MYETDRLILRQWQDSDLVPFTLMGQDPLVMEYFPALLNSEESVMLIKRCKEKFARYGFCFYACQLKESNEFIGFIGLSVPNFTAHFTPCVEIGWRIASPYWGKGYATEGAIKCLEIGFNEFKLNEIVSMAVKDNNKSIQIMQKIGMSRNAADDFLHPNFAPDHKLAAHVLYRIRAEDYFK